MRDATAEAYELVEHGLLNEEEFRDFAFANAAGMWCSMNPKFFEGTIVEGEVEKLLDGRTVAAESRTDAARINASKRGRISRRLPLSVRGQKPPGKTEGVRGMKQEAAGRIHPFTGVEFLESLRDSREVWI